MNPDQANTLFIDCGTLTGHHQTELELPQALVPFFNLPSGGGAETYMDMRLSNGVLVSFRAIYRENNGMWRIELSDAIPEIRTGDAFPVVGGVRTRRSDHAAVFTKIAAGGPSDYELQLVQIGSAAYNNQMASAAAGGNQHHTVGVGGRNYGWY
ncbi:MAG: hypothetical protein WDM76_09430 [Limisphaerales bacterium]